VGDLIRKHGISRPTYFWRSRYGGVSVSELKRMKDLEAENAKLKRMYADLALENTRSGMCCSENYNAVCEAAGSRDPREGIRGIIT
jgi:Transposase